MTSDKEQVSKVDGGLLVQAPAKINLSLLIAGKRADGFHEIETIMAKVNWFDELFIEQGEKEGIEVVCKGAYWAPEGKENLIYQACELFLKEFNLQAEVKVTLTKNIPAGSGLGSASSDAAATLIGLSTLFGIDAEQGKLSKLAEKLGSDVAFFLGGPLSLCSGKGEKIEEIGKIFNFSAILVLPGINASTERVYANYEHEKFEYDRLKSEIEGFAEKNRIDLVCKMCANMLESSCLKEYTELAELKRKIELCDIGPLCLSGSGSTFFIIAEQGDKKLVKWQRELKEQIGCKSIIVSNNRW